MGFPCAPAPAGLASLKPHISVIGSTLPVRCLFLDCSPVCGPASVGVGDGLGTVLLCIFLLSGESFHFLPRLAVLPSKGCSGQKTPPPLGVLSEPQENRARPQKATCNSLGTKGNGVVLGWVGGIVTETGREVHCCSPKTKREEEASVLPGTIRSQAGTFPSLPSVPPAPEFCQKRVMLDLPQMPSALPTGLVH